MATLRNLWRSLTPPAVMDFYERIRAHFGPFRDCARWDVATKVSSGYDQDVILFKVRNALLDVKRGAAIYERDSVLFPEIQYSWPLVAGLLWVAAQRGGRLNLLDFGGSLGSTYYQNRRFLEDLRSVRWSIVEQKHFVECGKREFENEHLRFYENVGDCFRHEKPDVILFSSVLQYLENPYGMLDVARKLGFAFVLIDRTPLIEAPRDRLTVQKVPPEIYDASYPAWFFSREKFLAFLCEDYELIEEFDALSGTIHIPGARAVDKGFIFRRTGTRGLDEG